MPAAARRVSVTRLARAPRETLRLVQQGEPVEITSHGRVVARLVPVEPSTEAPALRALLKQWRAEHPELPDDPFAGAEALRQQSPPREVEW